MAPLFSKVDLNKLGHDVQNEETLIYTKFGKDLFNISKVIGRKKVAQFFLLKCIWHYVPSDLRQILSNYFGSRYFKISMLFAAFNWNK